MHQADACYVALWRPSAVQRALVYWLFVCVEAEFDHTERQGSADEDIAAAICAALVLLLD